MLPEPGGDFLEGASLVLLVELGYLAGDGAAALRAEMLDHLFQRLHEPVGRLVENHRAGFSFQGSEERLPAFLLREESFEGEPVARESGGDDGRDAGRGARKRLDLDAFFRAGAGEEEARIGDAGRAGVADEGDVQAAQDALLDHLHCLVLIEFVMRLERLVDVVMLEEDRTRARVLRQDEVGFLQDLDGPEGHVVEIADRSRDDEKLSRHQPSFLRMAIMKLYTMSDLRFQSGNRASR